MADRKDDIPEGLDFKDGSGSFRGMTVAHSASQDVQPNIEHEKCDEPCPHIRWKSKMSDAGILLSYRLVCMHPLLTNMKELAEIAYSYDKLVKLLTKLYELERRQDPDDLQGRALRFEECKRVAYELKQQYDDVTKRIPLSDQFIK